MATTADPNSRDNYQRHRSVRTGPSTAGATGQYCRRVKRYVLTAYDGTTRESQTIFTFFYVLVLNTVFEWLLA